MHVVIAATHCFDKTLLESIIQDNVNPIDKVLLSTLQFTTSKCQYNRNPLQGDRERDFLAILLDFWAHFGPIDVGPKRAQKGLKIVWDPFGTIWGQFGPICAQNGPIWGPKGKLPGAFGAWEKHFRKNDPGIFDPALNYEKIKDAPRAPVQNPGPN